MKWTAKTTRFGVNVLPDFPVTRRIWTNALRVASYSREGHGRLREIGALTMKKFLITAAAVMALTAPAWAQADLDADGDGAVTFEEVQAVNPDITEDEFAAMDTDGDGSLSAEEVSAAEEAGLLTAGDDAADDGAAADEAPAEDAPAE